MATIRTPEPALLAIGVISVPEQIDRRMILRAAWLHAPWAGDGGPITAHFVVRSGGAPAWLDGALRGEEARHADILRMSSVPWDESRLRGPVLTLAAFIVYAARAARARYLAKVDDDAFVNVADLELMMRAVDAGSPGPMLYLGMLTWNSWFEDSWDRVGFGWGYGDAERSARKCHNASWAAARCGGGCGSCAGPFQFAAGYLIVLSVPLAAHLASVLPAECDRLRRASGLVTHRGYTHTRIFEDVWLGSFVHRRPPPIGAPVNFVSTVRSGLVSDLELNQWQSEIARSAFLVHVRSKEPRTLLALRGHMRGVEHCRPAANLSCAYGCRAFGVRGGGGGSSGGGGGGPRFCAGAASCRIRTRRDALCAKTVDIRRAVQSAAVRAEAQRLHAAAREAKAALGRRRGGAAE